MNALEVILLKSEGDTSYSKIFRESGINCKCISPIQFEFINVIGLKDYISKPNDYSGMIFTSQRSVEAVEKIYKSLQVSTHNLWKEKKIFGIGYSTAERLNKELGLTVIGREAANSQQLGLQIVQNVEPFSKPLLYPCGSLRKDELPILLAKNNIDFKAVTCYNTKQHPQLENAISSVLAEMKPDCIVFFSPSGVSFSIPLMRKARFDFIGIKIIAIGPTTNEALVKEGIPVFGICQEPTAQAIIKLLK